MKYRLKNMVLSFIKSLYLKRKEIHMCVVCMNVRVTIANIGRKKCRYTNLTYMCYMYY